MQLINRWILFTLILIIPVLGQKKKKESEAKSFKNKNEIDLKYLFFLPEGYDDDQKSKWPLILFLHGIGERGNDLELVKIHGIPKIVETEKKFPFIALSPQCPADYVWKDEAMQEAVLDLLLKILKNYQKMQKNILILLKIIVVLKCLAFQQVRKGKILYF